MPLDANILSSLPRDVKDLIFDKLLSDISTDTELMSALPGLKRSFPDLHAAVIECIDPLDPPNELPEKMTKKGLQSLAESKGIELSNRHTKVEMLRIYKEARLRDEDTGLSNYKKRNIQDHSRMAACILSNGDKLDGINATFGLCMVPAAQFAQQLSGGVLESLKKRKAEQGLM